MMHAFEIIQLPQTILVGCSAEMSYSNHQPALLWQKLMPFRNRILNKTNEDLYSVEIYPSGFFNEFNAQRLFTKIAGIPVTQLSPLPDGLGVFEIPAGSYARFVYQGTAQGAAEFYNTIFTKTLPMVGLKVDERPHVAIMGEKYRHNDPSSEEFILIPIIA